MKPISVLPFWALYLLSDFFYVMMYKVLKHRLKLVRRNLRSSFPERSEAELLVIEKRFYSHFCDLMVEVIKLFSISEKDAVKRAKFVNPEFLDKYYEQGQSIIFIGGHYNNWEYIGVSNQPQIKHQCVGIYAPMTNKFFEKKFYEFRTKYGMQLIPATLVTRAFVQNKNKTTLTVFAADQSPRSQKSYYWLNFLNQDTAIPLGPEAFAKKFNYPVVFARLDKVKRGYYELTLLDVTANPAECPDGYISARYTRILEEIIMERPEFWLWTHNRWKKSRQPEDLVIQDDVQKMAQKGLPNQGVNQNDLILNPAK